MFSRGLLHKFLSGQVLCHDEFTTCCILTLKPIYSTLYHGDILTLTDTGWYHCGIAVHLIYFFWSMARKNFAP